MAAPIDSDEIVYAAVSNIPIKLHSKHLRNYFSQFLEVGGFDCFHFKHRPERKVIEKPDFIEWCRNELDATVIDTAAMAAGFTAANKMKTALSNSSSTLDTSTVRRTFDEEQIQKEGFPRQPLEYNPSDEQINEDKQIIQKRHAQEQEFEVADSQTDDKHDKETTTCCVIRLYESKLNEFIAMYNKKNWMDEEGNTISQLCVITRIRVAVTLDMIENGETEQSPPKLKTRRRRQDLLEAQTISDAIPMSSLLKLEELNPPDIMPSGNVGTRTSVFNQLIRECRLPPKVVKRLGIVFPKSRTNKRYGSVPLEYYGEVLPGMERDKLVLTARGHAIYNTDDDNAKFASGTRKQMRMTKHLKNKRMGSGLKRDCDESWPEADDEDDDSGEEWERHEALHNDVTNQERTTERLFENDMEVTWDKGSSGLVFYTDAAYWDKAEGDFDEKTSDDWDVDMSAYYDPNGGDMDARASLDMRRQRAMKLGMANTSVFKSKTQKRKEKRELRLLQNKSRRGQRTEDMDQADRPIGCFERHTKGIGRKLMEAQGWVEGEGLGKTMKGMSQALDNIGQKMHDKRGIGYYGKKLNQKKQFKTGPSASYKPSGNREFIISTVYDDPKVTDPAEPLLRSQGPYHLKYRDEVRFTKGSEVDDSH
ncbi:G patch domain-containing protein 3-like isoform X1 [Asterias rubens]|uniref:G patch domain-containing protein 3-like isoform X1 n=1 Tax=Asterias rubens TaxID=7604 RepID=UPI0014552D62|nr:G patch domain-containing protein 3-like isoform X1 [Asterias rubens]